MSEPQIVGLSLVRNEDRFITRVLENVAGFCDRLIVVDHESTDQTPERVRAVAQRHPHLEYRRIRQAPESHAIIRPLAGTATWIFAVDGDEIYEPDRLSRLRERIKRGELHVFRQVYGHVLNVRELDETTHIARGYLAPPCRSMTKLFNFQAIRDWEGPCPQRLHGGRIVFADGYDATMNAEFHRQFSWEDSPFRCLHTVFLRRSSLDAGDEPGARMNVTERHGRGIVRRMLGGLRRTWGQGEQSRYKLDKYRRGDLVTKDVSSFFPENDAGRGIGS